MMQAIKDLVEAMNEETELAYLESIIKKRIERLEKRGN